MRNLTAAAVLLPTFILPRAVAATEITVRCDGARVVVVADKTVQGAARLDRECRSVSVQRGFAFAVVDGAVIHVDLTDPSSPKVAGETRIDGEVISLFEGGDGVWADVRRREALLVRKVAAATPGVVVPGAEIQVGRVLELAPGEAVINLGTKHGVTHGGSVRISRVLAESILTGEGSVEELQGETEIAVVRVRLVGEDTSVALLGPGERVRVGDRAQVSTRTPTASTSTPPRVSDVWEAAFTVRPFLALGSLGAGFIGDVRVGYIAEGPWHYEAIIDPMSVAVSEENDVEAVGALLFASFDTNFFEAGLGLGGSSVAPNASIYEEAAFEQGFDGTTNLPSLPRHAFAIGQVARLGSRDGISLHLRNTFLLYEDEFRYGSTAVTANAPIGARDRQMLLRIQGGQSGFFSAESGLRRAIRGNGDRGSLFLSATAGYGLVFGGRVNPVTLGGPMVGMGLEWRL